MNKIAGRSLVLFALVALVATSAFTLMAAPNEELDQDRDRGESFRPQPAKPFTPCPWPPCMGPCVFGAPPEVLCKSPDGAVSQTTFMCCCCGGSGSANSFKSLN